MILKFYRGEAALNWVYFRSPDPVILFLSRPRGMGLVGVGCHCYSRPHLTTLSQVYIFENQKRIFPNHFSSHAHAIKINQNWAALDGFDMV